MRLASGCRHVILGNVRSVSHLSAHVIDGSCLVSGKTLDLQDEKHSALSRTGRGMGYSPLNARHSAGPCVSQTHLPLTSPHVRCEHPCDAEKETATQRHIQGLLTGGDTTGPEPGLADSTAVAPSAMIIKYQQFHLWFEPLPLPTPPHFLLLTLPLTVVRLVITTSSRF